MPINFPANPTNNQVYTFGGKVWTFNGKGWYTATPMAANLLTVSTAIIPNANVAYDIGAPGARFRDLYLSANTIDLGGTAIKTTANGVSFATAANSQIAVPLTVSSVQLSTAGNIVTIQATATGLQAIGSSGTAVPIGGASVTVGDTAPTSPSLGSLWLDSETGDMYAYYGNAWAEFGKSGGGSTSVGSSTTANITLVSDQINLSTGYLAIPRGTTAQRPVVATSGMLRFNTTLNQAEIYNATDAAWVSFNTPKGTISNPVRSAGDTTNLPTGPVYIIPNGYSGAVFQTYLDNANLGGGWLLAFVVTNSNGSTVDWYAGDSSFAGYTGTDYFTTLNSTLNLASMVGLVKQNSKNPLMDHWATNSIMIREDYQGTIGYKAYTLTSTKTFYARFTDGTDPIDNNQSYNNQVSSIIGTVGTMGATFTTNTLDFNYTLLNDGARIAATAVSSEATGGISARVDQSRSYSWQGNLTRSDSGRAYGSSGATTDHTVWIFVR